MLFNSYVFIFLFLPSVLVGFYFLKPAHRMGFLIVASFIFYAKWNFWHTGLLTGSIVLNYFFAQLISQNRSGSKLCNIICHKRSILFIAIVLNLSSLVYFKYSFLLYADSQSLVLPLAISFYTFQQIAFLADLYRKKIALGTFSEYLFFVLFFPQLVAGPIVHYSEIMMQVKQDALKKVHPAFLQAGSVLFFVGLFKKIVLADQFFPIADKAFNHIDTLHTLLAWLGLFAYSLGIYFDFSGYTDMAIGLGLLFGLKLPINFNSPYKAVDIVDFWRRWHITLSNFLRDYIYIPLGGNRKGEYREVFNLILTMTLGGIWHGAGWTFLLWGLIYGLLLAFVHLKKRYLQGWKLPKTAAILLTFTVVSLLWVLFRSQSPDEAQTYYAILFGMSKGTVIDLDIVWVMAGLCIVWFLPNSMKFVQYEKRLPALKWQHAFVAALFAFAALKMMAEAPAQSFVYFNF